MISVAATSTGGDAELNPAARAGPFNRDSIDELLAAALRNADARWPEGWPSDQRLSLVLERLTYHGIAGLLIGRSTLDNWPASVTEALRRLAVSQSMWELRHQALLRPLLERLASAGVRALLLKGSALAYELYANPAARQRGDTDLLIHESDRGIARTILHQLGFEAHREDLPEELRSEENWVAQAEDETRHFIDLHWRPLNAPALGATLTVEECFAGSRPLPRLTEAAFAPSRAVMLLHACLHRSMHICSPYFVGGETYFGGDRLIWLNDIAELGRNLSEHEWRDFCRAAADKEVANACLAGIAAAEARLGRFSPEFVRAELGRGPSSAYFQSGQLKRALLDMLAVRGLRQKWFYVRARLLPNRRFMRAKYPGMGAAPLPLLHLRRFADLLRARP